MCSNCTRDVRGVIYCEECLASQVSGTMPPPGPGVPLPGVALPAANSSPGLAAILGFIPGVGAFYNGEYAKGFIHVMIFATLIWAADHVSGIFGIGIAAFVLYMPIEAYQTAKAKQIGAPAPDPFGFNNMNFFGGTAQPSAAAAPTASTAPFVTAEGEGVGQAVQPPVLQEGSRPPVGALILIGLGVVFLLDQFGWFRFDWFSRFWPLILIAVGVSVLMKRSGRVG
jgi:TM2 domain-containing membrane protein YozV